MRTMKDPTHLDISKSCGPDVQEELENNSKYNQAENRLSESSLEDRGFRFMRHENWGMLSVNTNHLRPPTGSCEAQLRTLPLAFKRHPSSLIIKSSWRLTVV